ncbi:hypothetical protein ABPG72_008469 [Tetrahymena utriculariae]
MSQTVDFGTRLSQKYLADTLGYNDYMQKNIIFSSPDFQESECQGCIEINCIGCKYGQNINGKCLKENENCAKGYFLDQKEKICKPCDVPFCLECSQSKQCQKCSERFSLDSYQSQCIVDQSQQQWEKYYKYTCSSLFIENQGDCIQKSLESRFQYTSIGSSIDQDYRKIFIDEQKLQVFCFVLANNQKNKRKIVVNIIQGAKIQFSIAQITDSSSGLLIQKEAQIIFYFQIFQQQMILAYASESQIGFFDLQNMQQQYLNLDYNFQKNIVVMISKKSLQSSSVLTFFILAQVEMVDSILHAINVKLDKQNSQSLTLFQPQYNFEYFNQNQGLIDFQSFNWFAYQIENEIYFLLLAYQVQNS